MMYTIRSQVLKGEHVYGVWCSMASSISSEIAAITGYDWILLDMEHAPGHPHTLLAQLQAVSAFATAPLVRVPALDRAWCKWALDLGASGIMFPNIDDAAQAEEAVSFLHYPPRGQRGVGPAARAASYGINFKAYAAHAHETILCIVQIESPTAVANCEAIAAIPGVDVLFVGPTDLSVSMGVPNSFADPSFSDTIRMVATVARNSGKAAGTLAPEPSFVPKLHDMGFTFIAVASDSTLLARALASNLRQLRDLTVT